MDIAYKDDSYKNARNLINDGKIIKIYAEDIFNYNLLKDQECIRDKVYIKRYFEETVNNLDTLKLIVKYLNRAYLCITRVEVVEIS